MLLLFTRHASDSAIIADAATMLPLDDAARVNIAASAAAFRHDAADICRAKHATPAAYDCRLLRCLRAATPPCAMPPRRYYYKMPLMPLLLFACYTPSHAAIRCRSRCQRFITLDCRYAAATMMRHTLTLRYAMGFMLLPY